MTLLWPIKGLRDFQVHSIFDHQPYISQGFGEHPEIYAQFGEAGHNGIDISTALGTPIYAAHDGRVSYFTESGGYGHYAKITNAECETVYGHQQRFEGVNRTVKAGDVIGYVNSTGFSTGNHLHLGLKLLKNGQILNYNNGYHGSINPMPFLRSPMHDNIAIYKNGNEYQVAYRIKSEEGLAQILFGAGAGDLLTTDGKPNFVEIDKITHVL